MVRFLLGLSLLSFFACSDKSGECSPVFFGGQIVNPTSDYVVLYHDDAYVDSVKLDADNRFSFQLEGIEEGLYHFDHSPELQYVYLKEGDSLLARLNTVEFDETLVFSGKGSEINNFMIEMFLTHEREEPLIQEYYLLDPEDFSKKIDSLRAIKMHQLKEFANDYDLSERDMEMAEASIDYSTYINKEKYPFYHKKKTGEDTFHDLDESFYAYRNSIDLNNKDLTYYRPYFNFMKLHFGNLSYMTCMESCTSEKKPVSDHLHFNKHKLAMVDSLVNEVGLRDILFRNIAIDYLLKERNPNEECEVFIDKFRSLSSNEEHKEEIDLLYNAIKNLQPNAKVPNLVLRDMENNVVQLKDVVNKKENTVIYFWTASQKRHFRNINQHIDTLSKKYPNHNFVGINLKTSYPQWKILVEEYGLDQSSQYYGVNFKEIQTNMVVDGLNKCVITKDTLVVDGFANLYTSL
ncbi:TlpA family protein disulfide reductase [Flagellimonas baculiformis]|uniref:TlpA family protein disulfide reductase n=1 Tax=Flagellimonas baculiformis TaxID=3067310 RepID=UPI00296EC7BA|nr:transaldolase [Muricauda sp. D6]